MWSCGSPIRVPKVPKPSHSKHPICLLDVACNLRDASRVSIRKLTFPRPFPTPHPEAEMLTLHDWAAFASLARSCTWTAEWFVVLDAPRVVGRFRPADVVAAPLRKVGPFLFWRPEDGKRQRGLAPNWGAPLAGEAWEDAGDLDALQDQEEEAREPTDDEQESVDDDDDEAGGPGGAMAKSLPHRACPSPRVAKNHLLNNSDPSARRRCTQRPSPPRVHGCVRSSCAHVFAPPLRPLLLCKRLVVVGGYAWQVAWVALPSGRLSSPAQPKQRSEADVR